MIRVGSPSDALRRAPLSYACLFIQRRFTSWFTDQAWVLLLISRLRPKPTLSKRSLLTQWTIDLQSVQTIPVRATSCWVVEQNHAVSSPDSANLQVRFPHANQVASVSALQVPSLILLPFPGLSNHEINTLLELRAVIASYQLPVVLLTTEDPELSSATLLELHEAAWPIRFVDPAESIRLLDTLAWQGRLPFIYNS